VIHRLLNVEIELLCKLVYDLVNVAHLDYLAAVTMTSLDPNKSVFGIRFRGYLQSKMFLFLFVFFNFVFCF
jgi:hypothetical protein